MGLHPWFPRFLANNWCVFEFHCLDIAWRLELTLLAFQQNKRVVLFSYGSGLAASMFSLTVRGPTDALARNLNLKARLAQRTAIEPAEFDEVTP